MITLIIIVASLLVCGVLAFKAIKKIDESSTRDERNNAKSSLTKVIVAFVAMVLIALIQPYSLERVDAGHVGIKVKLTGNSRGVSNYEYKTGWVIYNTWVEQMLEFPTYQQHIEYADQTVITKGGFAATIKPSFNYSLKPTAIGNMFENLRLDIKQIEQGWLMNAIVSSVNDVANKWEVDAIFNKREEFEAAIVAECNKRLSKWFLVSQLRTNIVPPKALQQAIESKTKAVQEAQASMQRKLVAEAEAQEKIAIAKGDSAQAVISASGRARANSLLQQSLTPMLLQEKWIEAWKSGGSKVPNYISGPGSDKFMLNIK